MCDERERLIGYLYDEADAAERREVEAHLDGCHVCRAEIAGLKAVRADLLAWDVPAHEPVWRPVPVVHHTPARRSMPAWAMVAAASLVFAAGVAGGMTTRMAWPSGNAPTTVAEAAPTVPVRVSVSAEELAAIEARVLERVRTEMQQEVRAVSAREPAARVAATPVNNTALDQMRRQMAAFAEWKENQTDLNVELDRKLNRIASRTTNLDTQLAWERMNTLRVNNTVGPDSGR